jgi:hypothetical protein
MTRRRILASHFYSLPYRDNENNARKAWIAALAWKMQKGK